MKKCLVVSDSFKGTLSSKQIGEICLEELKKQNISVDYIPVSDGGEGFIESIAFLLHMDTLSMPSIGALGDKGVAKYIYDENQDTLYVEMAEVCGLAKLNGRKDAYKASSYGLGLFVKEAIKKHHPHKIITSLGGTASIDLGMGFIKGMGAKFYDENGNEVNFVGNENLPLIKRIDSSCFDEYKDLEIVIVNDVKITIFGPEGTIEKYGGQKCSEGQDVSTLVNNASIFFPVLEKHTGISDHFGAGAAGGVAYAINAFLHGTEINGTDLIVELLDLKNRAKNYDFLITGEGKFDSQTLQGKLPYGVIKSSDKVAVICGAKDESVKDYKNAFAVAPTVCSFEESMKNPEINLRKLLNLIDWNNLEF